MGKNNKKRKKNSNDGSAKFVSETVAQSSTGGDVQESDDALGGFCQDEIDIAIDVLKMLAEK